MGYREFLYRMVDTLDITISDVPKGDLVKRKAKP
jgi:hypothetical protein